MIPVMSWKLLVLLCSLLAATLIAAGGFYRTAHVRPVVTTASPYRQPTAQEKRAYDGFSGVGKDLQHHKDR